MNEPTAGAGLFTMSDAAYHADPCPAPSLSSSIAAFLVERSPWHAWWHHPKLNPAWEPEGPSNTLEFGKLCHRLVLGKGAEIATWEGDDWRKKEARAFREEALAAGLIPVTLPQRERAEAVLEAFQKQMQLPEGHAERVWVAQDPVSDAFLRCRTDWDSGATIFDYKTISGSAHPRAAARHAANLGYDFQQAFYETVIGRVDPGLAGRLRFVFLFQEVDPPHALSQIEFTEADVGVQRRRVDFAIECWAECLRSGDWPGYRAEPVRMPLPEWRLRQFLEEEVSDGA